MNLGPDSADVSNSTALASASPKCSLQIRSSYDFANEIPPDVILLHVDELESMQVPAHTQLDVKLGWLVQPHLEFSLIGQSLLGSRHSEFGGPAARSEYERATYAGLVWGR